MFVNGTIFLEIYLKNSMCAYDNIRLGFRRVWEGRVPEALVYILQYI